METRFVKAFASPQMVVKCQPQQVIGVFDGARKFDNGTYAVLKDGVVTLYRTVYYSQDEVILSDLEDIFVTPNGYILLKRKDEDDWQLWDRNKEILATGEKACVFQEGHWCLVFLKQKGKSEWIFFDVNKNSILPLMKKIEADELDVRYDNFSAISGRLMFIVTLNGKTILHKMDTLYLKPAKSLEVPFYACLPDGKIVVADALPGAFGGRRVIQIMPQKGGVLSVYSKDFDFCYCTDGIAMVGTSAVLRLCDSKWSLFVGKKLVKDGILDLEMYAGVMAYAVAAVGRTADGKPVKISSYAPGKVVLNYGDERFFIFDDVVNPVVVQANDTEDVFLIKH